MAQLHGGKWKVGDIRLWFKKEIPRNWVLCDGENGTPKTTGRVVVGAGFSSQTYGEIPALGDQLGNTFITPSGAVQNHTLSVAQMPAHQIRIPLVSRDNPGSHLSEAGGYNVGRTYVTPAVGGSEAHAHGLTLDSIDVRQKGVGVYYIMKIR